ncbi:MAG: hypothetical protein ACHQF4_10320, partial [Sphingobacteriales bacterium]
PVILKYINEASSKSIIGFARSLLALGLVLTLLFNPIDLLIPAKYLTAINQHSLKFHSNFFLIFGPAYLFITRLLAVALLLFTISGYYMQLTSILHFWITASLVLIKPTYLGGDNVNMLLTLLLVPVCIFDTRKNHWHTPMPDDNFGAVVQNLFLFLIKIQVAWIYLDSVWLKLRVKEWRDGTVLYYWFNHNFFGLNPPFSGICKPLLERLPVSVSITWGVLIFEVLLCVGFLFPGKAKVVLLKWGIIFHFMILLIYGLAWLFFAMSAALFLYLWPSNKSFKLNLFLND